MKEFYYLDAQNKPCGPHSADELRALLILARLTPDTLITHKGSDKWVPLSTFTAPATPLPPVSNPVAGNCPKCGEQLTFTNGRFPSRCPHCGFRLCADNPYSLWSNFKLAISKTFVLRGRATRIEFWSYYLFSTIFVAVIQLLCTLLGPEVAWKIVQDPSDFNPYAGIVLSIILAKVLPCLIHFVLAIPQLTATVRRLHDIGKSGRSVLILTLLFANTIAALITTIVLGLSTATTSDELLLAIGISCFFALATFGMVIYLFILTLQDSQRGQNKYGPSSKYPLG